MSRLLWGAAQILAIGSGVGFALASTVAPGAINMGIGVGIVAVPVAALALWHDHTERSHR